MFDCSFLLKAASLHTFHFAHMLHGRTNLMDNEGTCPAVTRTGHTGPALALLRSARRSGRPARFPCARHVPSPSPALLPLLSLHLWTEPSHAAPESSFGATSAGSSRLSVALSASNEPLWLSRLSISFRSKSF